MKIPVYDQPSVGTQPIGAPQTSVDPSGLARAGQGAEQFGQAASQVVAQASQLFQQKKSEAEAAEATDLETKLQEKANALKYDPQNGLMLKRGDQLFPDGSGKPDLGAQTFEQLAKYRDELISQASSPGVQRAFQMRSAGLLEANHAEISRHVAQQVEVAKQASVEGLKATSKQALAQNYADPVLRARYMAQPEGPISALAVSPEDRAAKLAEWRATGSAIVLNQYIAAQDVQGASDFLSQARDNLGEQAATFQHRVTQLKGQVEADKKSSELIAAHTMDDGRTIDGAVWQDVEKEPPGPLRDKLEEQVAVKLNRANQAYRQVEDDRKGRVFETIERSGGFIDQSSDDWQMMSPTDKAHALEKRNAVMRMQRTTNAEERRAQAEADKEAIAGFSAIESPQDRATVNVDTSFPGASPAARLHIKGLQNKVRAQLGKGEGEKLHEFDAQIKTINEQMGFSMGEKDAPGPGADFKAKMDAWYMEQLRANNGRPPTREEAEKHFAEELQQSKGGLFGFGKRYHFQVEPGEEFEPRPPEEQPYLKYRKRVEAPTSPAPTSAAASVMAGPQRTSQTLPAGVKRGSDGKLYQRNPAGKWAPYNG